MPSPYDFLQALQQQQQGLSPYPVSPWASALQNLVGILGAQTQGKQIREDTDYEKRMRGLQEEQAVFGLESAKSQEGRNKELFGMQKEEFSAWKDDRVLKEIMDTALRFGYGALTPEQMERIGGRRVPINPFGDVQNPELYKSTPFTGQFPVTGADGETQLQGVGSAVTAPAPGTPNAFVPSVFTPSESEDITTLSDGSQWITPRDFDTELKIAKVDEAKLLLAGVQMENEYKKIALPLQVRDELIKSVLPAVVAGATFEQLKPEIDAMTKGQYEAKPIYDAAVAAVKANDIEIQKQMAQDIGAFSKKQAISANTDMGLFIGKERFTRQLAKEDQHEYFKSQVPDFVSDVEAAVGRELRYTPPSLDVKGGHNDNSKHYVGLAFDIGGKFENWSDADVAKMREIGRQYGFKVLDERTRPKGQKVWSGPHIHVEFTGEVPLSYQEIQQKREAEYYSKLQDWVSKETGKIIRTPAQAALVNRKIDELNAWIAKQEGGNWLIRGAFGGEKPQVIPYVTVQDSGDSDNDFRDTLRPG